MKAKSTLSVPEAGKLLGCSRGTSYELVRQNRFPVPVLRVGHKLRVPRAPLLRLLGIQPGPDAEADATAGAGTGE